MEKVGKKSARMDFMENHYAWFKPEHPSKDDQWLEAMSQITGNRLIHSEHHMASQDNILEIVKPLGFDEWLETFWMFANQILQVLDEATKKDASVKITSGTESSESNAAVEKQKRNAVLKREISKTLQGIEEWCLIPTKKLTQYHLVAIKNASMVVRHVNKSKVYDILKKCGVHQLTWLPSSQNALRLLVSTIEDVLACLCMLYSSLKEGMGNVILSSEEAETLLKYFSNSVHIIQQDSSAIEKLKDLPLYLTVYKKLSKLTDYRVYVLPVDIPKCGLEVSQERTGVMFLQDIADLKPLYELLQCQYINSEYFYCNFLFQCFEYLTGDERIQHLYYLYTNFCLNRTNSHMLQRLKTTALITDTGGSLQLASYFYDQSNPVFAAFTSERTPPRQCNKPFYRLPWKDFLVKLGLVQIVLLQHFLEYARQTEKQSCRLFPADKTVRKSKVLMNCIYDMKKADTKVPNFTDSDHHLQTISTICFVEPATISDELESLCPAQVTSGGYMQLSGSIPSEYEELVWTQVQLLPDWADPLRAPLDTSHRNQLRQALGIQERPSVDVVLDHLCMLVSHPRSKMTDQTHSLQPKLSVLESIYSYIEKRVPEEDTTDLTRMSSVKCILLEKQHKLVAPGQIAIDLSDSEEISLLLYKLPERWMAFRKLFEQMGAAKTASVSQYMMVLDHLYRETTGVPKSNQIRKAFMAIKGLFKVAEEEFKFSDSPLYLLSNRGTLVLSTRLVYNDVPSFTSRIKEFEGTLLFNLTECGMEPRQAIKAVGRLPKQHRTRLLSNEIEEILVSSVQIKENDRIARQLNQRIHEDKFHEVVGQLILHQEHHTAKQDVCDITNRLAMVEVTAVDRVHTVLKYKLKGTPILHSNLDKACHVQECSVRGATRWSVYIKEQTSLNQDYLIPLARVINNILDGRLRDSILNLLLLLNCTEDEMVHKLEELNINTGALPTAVHRKLLPLPGAEVLSAEQQKLSRDVSNIEVKDLVVYKACDNAVPVYAVVVDITDEGDTKRFKLDIGDGKHVVVNAEKLLT